MNRNYQQTAATWAALGFLAGLIAGLASCQPSADPKPVTVTELEQVWLPR